MRRRKSFVGELLSFLSECPRLLLVLGALLGALGSLSLAFALRFSIFARGTRATPETTEYEYSMTTSYRPTIGKDSLSRTTDYYRTVYAYTVDGQKHTYTQTTTDKDPPSIRIYYDPWDPGTSSRRRFLRGDLVAGPVCLAIAAALLGRSWRLLSKG